MWKRFAKILRCPQCRSRLTLRSFSESVIEPLPGHIALAEMLGVMNQDFKQYVQSGVLLCEICFTRHPIIDGLPIMLPYTTSMHEEFARDFSKALEEQAAGYHWPTLTPVKGELSTMRSFSQEWRAYKYDGVLWHNRYEDLEKMFLQETGFKPGCGRHEPFIEIGCGIGVTTWLAQKHYRGEAVGVDLSFACMQAAHHYRANPFLHFVQASAFHLPFAERSFGLVYSRGVLHHTYSTREAFRAVAELCRDGGLQYVWVYGPGSNNDSVARRVWFAVETVFRPIFSRWPTAPPTKLLLSVLTVPYQAANWFLRRRNPGIQKYTYHRAVHAARDRFTPRYAHRHSANEVQQWFSDAGFEGATQIDWRSMPTAQQDTYRRNVGLRGQRPTAPITVDQARA